MSLGTSGTVYAVSKRRPTDPTGTVAGFADAHGDWLPLACTLNCTLAVDRVATLLGLDREAVEPVTGVTLLPYLDGERTPNLPNASGLLHGLRHDTTGGQLLQAAYDGAVQVAARRARPGARRGRGPLGPAAADRRRRPRHGLAAHRTTALGAPCPGARGRGTGRARAPRLRPRAC